MVGHRRDETSLGVFPRIGRVEAVRVGEKDEQIGFHQKGHLRRQGVVVAKAQLVGGSGVVLVDDGDDLPLQQSVEGVPGVEVLGPRGHVERREEHLRGHDMLVGEELGIDVEQMSLADGGRRLQVDDGGGPALATQHPHARRDCAR